MNETEALWENIFQCRETSEEHYFCPQCGARLEPEEDVYYGTGGVAGCAECLFIVEAQEVLGQRDAA